MSRISGPSGVGPFGVSDLDIGQLETAAGTSWKLRQGRCQPALKIDPPSASKIDPPQAVNFCQSFWF